MPDPMGNAISDCGPQAALPFMRRQGQPDGPLAAQAVERRLESLELAFSESREAQARLDGLLTSMHAKFGQLHGHIVEETRARDASRGDLRPRGASRSNSQGQLPAQPAASSGASTASLHERLEVFEGMLTDIAERHTQDIAATQSKLEQLQARLNQEQRAREAHHNFVCDQLAKDRDANASTADARDSLHASLQQRVEYIERVLGESADRHSQEIEAVKSAHAKLFANEARAREVHHASWAERISYVEKLLSDFTSKHADELTSAHGRIDQLHERVAAEQKEREARLGSVAQQSQRDKDAREALQGLHVSLKDRVDYLERVIGDAVDKHAQELAATHAKLEQLHGKMAQEAKAREAHTGCIHEQLAQEKQERDVNHASFAERLTYLEQILGDSADKRAQDAASLHAKLEKLHGRLAASEAGGSSLESLKQAHERQVKDLAAVHAHRAALDERVAELERVAGMASERKAQDVATALSRLEQLQGRLQDEVATREAGQVSMQGFMSREKEAREKLQAFVQERLRHLEELLGESADKHSQDLHTQHSAIQSRVGVLVQKLSDELGSLREHFHGERQLRAQHYETVTDHLSGEKRARDAIEQAVQHHLTRERQAREAHELALQEQLGLERGARERHQEHLQELVLRERDVRERGLAAQQEQLDRERAAREAAHKEVVSALAKERATREQQHLACQELIQQERQSKRDFEELVTQQFAEHGRQHETVLERVDGIQRAVASFEGVIRREIEERSAEAKHIWRAIDSHTHDLTTQTVEVAAEPPLRPPPLDFPGAAIPSLAALARLPLGQNGLVSPASAQEPRKFGWPPVSASTPPVPGGSALQAKGPGAAQQPGGATTGLPIRALAAGPGLAALARAPAASTTQPLQAQLLPAGYLLGGKLGSRPSPRRLAERCGRDRPDQIEKLSCGHTRYSGELQSSAEIPLH